MKEYYNVIKIPTSSLRRRPDFLIIGAQKSGTTSLFSFIAQHPDCRMPSKKEIHYFDLNYSKGLKWYLAHFPLYNGKITGEATPYYLFHPDVPSRVKELFSDIKIIVILRNPIDRAYSHFQMERRNKREVIPDFFEAICQEEIRLSEAYNKGMIQNQKFIHQHKSYLSRGLYYTQLKRWYNLFDSNNIVVFIYEDFFDNPSKYFKRICDHLNLPYTEKIKFSTLNKGDYNPSISLEEHNHLKEFFIADIRNLDSELGIKTNWF